MTGDKQRLCLRLPSHPRANRQHFRNTSPHGSKPKQQYLSRHATLPFPWRSIDVPRSSSPSNPPPNLSRRFIPSRTRVLHGRLARISTPNHHRDCIPLSVTVVVILWWWFHLVPPLDERYTCPPVSSSSRRPSPSSSPEPTP